jgi:phosphoglycerate kinase
MVNTTDNLLIGGAASFTFLKTYGCDVPSYEENVVNEVASVISVAKSKLTLPRDFLKADDLSNSNITQIKLSDIHPHEILGDIGNETLNEYINILDKSKSILFYGPLGICEVDSFQNGTKQILEKLKELTTKGVYTFIGGIDLIITLHAMGYKTTDFSYVSVAGNNTLNLLEHIIMPTLELIPNSASK